MTLFDQIVEASGLTRMLAPFTMTRLLVKAGFAPARVTPDELREALPVIRQGLAVYLSEAELEAAMARLAGLAGAPDDVVHAS